MKKQTAAWILALALLVFIPGASAQDKTQPAKTGAPASANAQKKNIQAYVELMRSNVRDQKSEIMGSVMQLSIDDAAKFWPIYSEYDAELTKLNNLRVQNITDYAENYSQMTDAKADELVQSSLDYQKQRGELLAKYYERMKGALGAITAARFLMVEHQLLLLIDLQIASSLPIVGQGS